MLRLADAPIDTLFRVGTGARRRRQQPRRPDGRGTNLSIDAAPRALVCANRGVAAVLVEHHHLVRASLTSLEGRLAPETFVRAHRTAIVNLKHVRETQDRDGLRLVLSEGTQVGVRRSRRSQVESLLSHGFGDTEATKSTKVTKHTKSLRPDS